MSDLALTLGRSWQGTVSDVFLQLRQEAESIAEAIPQVRILDFFNLTLVSWRAKKKRYSYAMHPLRQMPQATSLAYENNSWLGRMVVHVLLCKWQALFRQDAFYAWSFSKPLVGNSGNRANVRTYHPSLTS